MRRVLPVLLLLACAACSQGLNKSSAEAVIRAKYPVIVPVEVPARITEPVNSPKAQRAQAFMDNLQKAGWFDITKTDDKGGQVTYSFAVKPGAPGRATEAGWLVPAAQAVFVNATGLMESGNTAKVTYQIKLANPTAQFALFELLHPAVHIGDSKPRHAVFEKQGGTWVLTDTDESFTRGG
ncbi:MAG TPA: hypothetical protein VNV60_05705 [Holophagaceae bacterium]|nr:hypothetical protein [Holophagaceae bacterium]